MADTGGPSGPPGGYLGSDEVRVFVIPDEPVPKGRPRFTKAGHVYTPVRTKQSEWRIRQYIAERMASPFQGPLSLIIHIYLLPPKMPKKWQGKRYPAKRPDIDNYIKTVMDALHGVAFTDDSQIVDLYAAKRYAWNHNSPGWVLSLRRLGDLFGE